MTVFIEFFIVPMISLAMFYGKAKGAIGGKWGIVLEYLACVAVNACISILISFAFHIMTDLWIYPESGAYIWFCVIAAIYAPLVYKLIFKKNERNSVSC